MPEEIRGLRIRNWAEFQHYRDRNPPWIKLHFALLSSPDWLAMDDASRVLAVASMLLASRYNGFIPMTQEGAVDNSYIKRVAYLNTEPDFKPLIDCGFLEYASITLADRYHLASTPLAAMLVQRRGETEKKFPQGANASRAEAEHKGNGSSTPPAEPMKSVAVQQMAEKIARKQNPTPEPTPARESTTQARKFED